MAHGKHRKKKEINYRPIAIGSAVGLGLVGVGTTANAATMSEWDRVAKCESGGQWNLPRGDRDSTGGLQFRVASWQAALSYLRSHGVDTSAYPAMPYQATKRQQIMAGEALLAMQGPRAWSVTFNGGAHCGNAAAGALSTGSMFEGGPNPYAGVSEPGTKEPGGESSEAPSEGKTGGTYTVKSGDWLAKIARAKLGAADKWRAIYDLNKSVIGGNPNLIHPGQKFKMPGSSVAESGQKPKPAPKPPASNASYVAPVQGRVGDGLIVGSGGSMSRSAGGHSGVDIMAPHGTPVRSAAAGTVASINRSGGAYGLHVVVKHGAGVYTLYAHLSRISVSVGQSVSAGQQVGNVGSTGNSSGAHLHFELRNHPTAFTAGTFLNPLTWLRGHGVSI